MIEYKIGTKFNDVLTKKIIKTWNNKNIILNGATGSGKTYFIEHNLHNYCIDNNKNILFLCNRTGLFDEILLEKEKLGLCNMDIMLYQTLQSKIQNNDKINNYNYIVCDEFHYVLTDALFNIYTDLTYDWLKSRKNSIKIFMSGTGGNIFNKLIEDKLVNDDNIYKIPYDYSYANIKFYKEKNKVYDIINNILCNTDDKAIFFANSLKEAKEVYKQFKEDSIFRCSKSQNDGEAQQINQTECIKTYSKKLITFDNRILITTKALDNGITIRDEKIKHIICDIFDFDSAQQSLGRKRINNKDDTCTFYIRNYTKKAIGNFKGGFNSKYIPVKMFVEDIDNFNKEYSNNRKFHSDYIYFSEGERKYNKLAYWKMTNTSNEIELCENIGYDTMFLSSLKANIEYSNLEELEVYEMKDEFQLYLEEIEGEKLFKEEQEKLINKINLTDKRGRLQTSIKSINTYLQENYKYTLISKVDKRRKLEDGSNNPNRDKKYWVILEGIN